jgi:hypothetical protein
MMKLKQRRDMRVYQKQVSDLIVRTPALLVVLPVGAGKTVTVLDAIEELLYRGKARRVLIVAPLRVAEEVWPDEIEAWEHLRDLSYSVVTGSEQGRILALRRKVDLYIINRENVQWLWKTIEELELPDFDMIIVDESTMLAEGRKRTTPKKVDGVVVKKSSLTRFGALMKMRKYADRVVELTGTVAPNGLMSLWGQVFALDYGERLGDTKESFRRTYFQSDYGGYKYTPVPGAMERVMSRVKDIVIEPDVSKYLDKVPVRENIIKVHLTDSEMRRYKKFERTLYENETDIEAITEGVLTNKLLQLANGSLYREDGAAVAVHDHKLHALETLVEELNGENLLVAYSFQFDLQRIRKRFKKAVVLAEEPDAYRDWNKGKIKMLLCHPKSAGHGLNMQFGGHHACWYGMNWSLELYQQFNGRLPRTGQKNGWVMLHHIITAGTKDESVIEKMRTGALTQEEIQLAIRRELSEEYGHVSTRHSRIRWTPEERRASIW